MVDVKTVGDVFSKLDFLKVKDKMHTVAKKIEDRSGSGNDYLGWLDYASKLKSEDINDIKETAKRIREEFDCLVVCGIGGSYLGARAVIEAINGLYSDDDFEIIYFGNTLSSTYSKQILKHLKNKKFAINVISKSGTTTETALAFRLLKDLIVSTRGEEALKDSIFATTDKSSGALKKEADQIGYKCFEIPSNIGGRYSVITPVGLLPIACADIDIEEFLKGVIDGQRDYSSSDIAKNSAYLYGLLRYCLYAQVGKTSEMFISYEPQYAMIGEWLKQLFDESEGKEGKALLCGKSIFTTDLHSMGQFIQEGSHILFETIIHPLHFSDDVAIKGDDKNLDNLNYLTGKKLSEVNEIAYQATLKAHSEHDTPAIVLSFDKMDAYNLGNLVYFFFRACAFSAYLLDVNPFNQPGVEIYKKNMFKMLGKPGYKD